MIDSLWTVRMKMLVIVAALLLSTISLPRALGQAPDANEPTAEIALPPEMTSDSASADSTERFFGDHCRPNYWIVSSRHCSQDNGRCHICCAHDYYHFASDGCLRKSSAEEFHQALVPPAPICVVVHGSFVNRADVQEDSFHTYRWLRAAAPNRPLHVVFYTWPSEGFDTWIVPIDLALLGRRSAFNGLYLSQLIARFPADRPVSLLGHSHGARTVSSTLHLLGGGLVQGHGDLQAGHDRRRIRAVLAAAAMDHHWLNPGERYGRALCRAECLLNLRNRRDIALSIYPLRKPFSHRSLARAGFTTKDRTLMGIHAHKIGELEVTRQVDTGHMWPNYYRHPCIAHSIRPYLYFDDAAEQPVEESTAIPVSNISAR